MKSKALSPQSSPVRSRMACENSRYNVWFEEVQCPNGAVVPDYLVVEPKESRRGLITGVGILPVCGGKFGLVRIFRQATKEYLWEIPRGYLEPWESEVGSAVRELEEETGFSCAPSEMLRLGTVVPDAGVLRGKLAVYLARNCVKLRDFTPNEIGHKQLRFFSNEEIREMVASDGIQDSYTLAAFFWYGFKG